MTYYGVRNWPRRAVCSHSVGAQNGRRALRLTVSDCGGIDWLGGARDFFRPGTTVGIPFAAQLGIRVTF